LNHWCSTLENTTKVQELCLAAQANDDDDEHHWPLHHGQAMSIIIIIIIINSFNPGNFYNHMHMSIIHINFLGLQSFPENKILAISPPPKLTFLFGFF
jgi:hypothetical protein